MYAAHGVKLVEMGWPAPFPLRPREKRPAIRGWERFNVEPVSPARAHSWAKTFPDHGIGLAAGHGLLAIDLDTDLEDQAKLANTIADEALGKTPMIRAGRRHRVMRHYRLQGLGFQSVTTAAFHLFGIYATTGQTVLFGIHPDTNRPYTWLDASPLDLGPTQLPSVTLAKLEEFVTEMTRAFPETTTHEVGRFNVNKTWKAGTGGPASPILRELSRRPNVAPLKIAARIVWRAPVGKRHETMVGAIVALVETGLTDDEIYGPILEAHTAALAGDRSQSSAERVVENAIDWARERIGSSLDELDKSLSVDDWSIWK